METPFPAYKGDEPYVFVSYAHDDSSQVYPEITRLHDQGFNVWYMTKALVRVPAGAMSWRWLSRNATHFSSS